MSSMSLRRGLVVFLSACAVYGQSSNPASSAAQEQAALEAIAQQLSPCSVQCFAQYVPASGCSITDTACMCTNEDLKTAIGACLVTNCTTVEALEAQRFTATTCGAPVRSQQRRLYGVSWGLYGLSCLAVLARFTSRSSFLKGAGYGLDDYTIALTQLVMTAITVSAHLMVYSGLGRDMWMLNPGDISAVLRWFWIDELVYTWCVGLTKMSIILFYLRVFPDTVSTGFRKICYAILVLQATVIVSFNLAVAFQCNPISYSWTRWDAAYKGTCTNTTAIIYAGAGLNLILDLICFILPIPRLLTIQISKKKKAGICLTFLVGLFVTLCALIRLGYLIRWRATTNPTWSYSVISLWSIIECNVGIVCACMPALSGPIKRAWQATIGKQLSSLYHSQSRPKTPTLESSNSRSVGTGWRNLPPSAAGGNVKRADSKTNTIMRNVSLNVSDEMELVDRGRAERRKEFGHGQHGYREEW